MRQHALKFKYWFTPDVNAVMPLLQLKVIRLGATPVSLSLLSIQVYASSSEKDTSKKELLKIEELSLYSSPARETKYVENPQTQLEEGVSHLRHVMEPYTAWCQDLYAKAIPKLEKAVEHGREGCEFLQNPPAGFYPRLGVIGFAGIVGLFLARGSKIKKLVYPVGLMGIGASMYYPQQAVAIAKVAGTHLYDWSLQGYIAVESLWKDNPKKKKSVEKSDKGDAEGDKSLEIHAASNEERARK
ncbi:MICOS complex subunit MIC26 isoform X2 [Aquila chrysaetos chrysaetos]|uniref:MICOS complex subunit n=1 Tax=Aquila chrysaetos chrysaetos TaxID=223781 RepID=A0A663DZ46_AQUCH|nr:MICOS complex subunit MIC26 isoform X2 [Aquila chrysaetos chrysaetos]